MSDCRLPKLCFLITLFAIALMLTFCFDLSFFLTSNPFSRISRFLFIRAHTILVFSSHYTPFSLYEFCFRWTSATLRDKNASWDQRLLRQGFNKRHRYKPSYIPNLFYVLPFIQKEPIFCGVVGSIAISWWVRKIYSESRFKCSALWCSIIAVLLHSNFAFDAQFSFELLEVCEWQVHLWATKVSFEPFSPGIQGKHSEAGPIVISFQFLL